VWLSLRNEGAVISARTVLKLMQEMGVQGKRRRTSYHSYKRGVEGAARNIIDRNFKAERPDEKFATDISMIKIHGKYRYLSAIIDMFNGEVRGYAISAHPDIVLVRRTLDRFMESAGRHVSGSILHSDQGCQYKSSEYINTLAARGIIQSMSRKGNCLDNAMMENFFALMKVELLYSRDWDDMNQFVTSLHSYIRWYNMDRLKLRLNGLTPYQARQEYYRKTIRKNV
jgi:putative transposase